MASKETQQMRCAIYTRKSTEHGLELEFNSLDAQREACEAYIKSQAHEGWQAVGQRYDDPAYSGGSLERPALQQLLTDVDAGRVNVIVVYKIDRLTRSLADFAKLVEIFDKKGVSFVAVTQQFNTTTSMGRLTLNVLLSFAQFERELSSERVRDKVAASRRKGKWTGGGIPLGYDVTDKKLTINPAEAETVRYIFKRYLDLKCLRLLSEDLTAQRITTKQRRIKNGSQTGGRRFTYGPLAYLLKNRTYLGEMGHKGECFAGEHEPIIDRATFDQVQHLMKANSVARRQNRSEGRSLLTGLLFDDRGNRMSPSFSTKRGVRYRFYVSSAILSGRKDQSGSVTRISAPELEGSIVLALRERFEHTGELNDQDLINTQVERIVLGQVKLLVTLKTSDATGNLIELARSDPSASPRARIETDNCQLDGEPDTSLIYALARAHFWLKALADGTYQSIDELADIAKWNPKVIRKVLRLAFLAPDITEAIILGSQPKSLSVSELQAISAHSWTEQRRLLKFPVAA
jgi:DNA invertase Pin-like site-specific DNA recombinase